MTVEEMFEEEKLDIHFINGHFDGPYWEKCDSFVREKWFCVAQNFTMKQAKWLDKIIEDCAERRIEGPKNEATGN